MNWFARGRRKTLSIAWEYTTRGNLWRLLPTSDGKIVIEDRNVEQKTVSFACLDHATGKVLWKDVKLDEQWWITIDSVHREVLFLHEYASPDMPEQKRIVALGLDSGKTMWTNEEMKLLFCHESSVYAAQAGVTQLRFFELDLLTGNIRGELDDQYLGVLRETVTGNSLGYMNLPSVLDGPHGEELLHQSVKRATVKATDINFVEYLVAGHNHILGYYETKSGSLAQQSLRQHFCIVDHANDTLVFSDVVNESSSIAVPGTFFGLNSLVYYIKNKKTLRALNLTENYKRNGKN